MRACVRGLSVYICMRVYLCICMHGSVHVCLCKFACVCMLLLVCDDSDLGPSPSITVSAHIRTHERMHTHRRMCTHKYAPSFIKFVYRRSGVFAPLVGKSTGGLDAHTGGERLNHLKVGERIF